MNSLVLALLAVVGFIVAYHTYGKYLGHKIFKLTDKNHMPAHKYNDGVDFVPTKKHIIFGHHFTTIAGLGPIVGPAIGIIWGWVPAFIWVFLGSIFMGAVHDFTALIISARNKGKSLGELTGDIISPSTKYAFQFIMQFLLLIVLAVFAMIVGILFVKYPQSVLPVWLEIPIAIWLGYQVRKGKNDTVYSIIAAVLLYVSVVACVYFIPPITVPALFGSPVVTWAIILYIYTFFASTMPVQTLLQPRDYINSHQLIIALLLIIVGLIVAHPTITAPAVNEAAFSPDSDIPSMMPLLFITIACGAISGFHSLASSGTTVKQVDKETDTLFIGYGGMLWEGFLATLVLMAIAGGLGMGLESGGETFIGSEAFAHHYSSWTAASGLAAKLEAFIVGSANLLESMGIPMELGSAIIAVFIVSFANTTLDSSARIQRIAFQEMFKDKEGKVKKPVNNRYVATAIVVGAAMLLTFIQPEAKGAMFLWPLFGALNQLIAALALGVVTVYLSMKGKNIYLAFIPMLFILFMTIWAMFNNINSFIEKENWVLFSFSVIILGLATWLLISGSVALKSMKTSRISK